MNTITTAHVQNYITSKDHVYGINSKIFKLPHHSTNTLKIILYPTFSRRARAFEQTCAPSNLEYDELLKFRVNCSNVSNVICISIVACIPELHKLSHLPGRPPAALSAGSDVISDIRDAIKTADTGAFVQ